MSGAAQVYAVYEALAPIAPYFSIAAAFGNVHGVYKPGNVVLNPTILGKHQAYVGEKTGKATPLYLVFHGGSGSTKQEIKTAVSNGVVKMNIDTDTQWAYWTGLCDYFFIQELGQLDAASRRGVGGRRSGQAGRPPHGGSRPTS